MLGNMQLVRAQIDAILAALIDTGGPFDPDALYAGVGSALTDNGVDTVLADITLNTGAIATIKAVTWGTPYVLDDGSAVVDSDVVVFTPAGVETGNVAVVFLSGATPAVSILAYLPEVPNVPVSAIHPYSLVLRLVVDPSGRWSVSFSWNS